MGVYWGRFIEAANRDNESRQIMKNDMVSDNAKGFSKVEEWHDSLEF